MDKGAQERQFKKSLVKFTKLLWAMDAETSMQRLAGVPQAGNAYREWCSKNSPHELAQLEFWLKAAALAEAKAPPAHTLAAHVVGL